MHDVDRIALSLSECLCREQPHPASTLQTYSHASIALCTVLACLVVRFHRDHGGVDVSVSVDTLTEQFRAKVTALMEQAGGARGAAVGRA